MGQFVTLAEIDQSADEVRARIARQPRFGIVLGSGLGLLADSVKNPVKIPYSELPNWPVSTVLGHQGQLVVGELAGQDVLVMQGRAHYYEGYGMDRVTLPVRVMQRLGVEIMIVTNAAGSVNPDYEPGDLMMIIDHINLLGMAGPNPLRGPNLDEFGLRFPDMSRPYDRELSATAREVAVSQDIVLHEGVYICLAGPSFETPADLRFLRAIGVDAVGMSTVPEVIVARHSGMRVLGISGISNKANLDGNTITTHDEVLEAGEVMAPKLIQVIQGIMRKI
jgi:purine-nucleoside phosphorylase